MTTTSIFSVGRTSQRPALFLRCLLMRAMPASDSMYVSSRVMLLQPPWLGRMQRGYGHVRQK
jgi:hypothetical protein